MPIERVLPIISEKSFMHQKLLSRVKIFIHSAPLYLFYIITLIAVFIYATALYYFNLTVFNQAIPFAGAHKNGIDAFSFGQKAFTVLCIVPFVESFIAQFLLIELFCRVVFFKKKPHYAIFLSALMFGLLHYYSLYYMLYTFGVGFILCSFYYFVRYRKGNAYLHTCLIHFIINLIVLLAKVF